MKRLLLVLSLAITFMGGAQITQVCYKNHSTQQALGSSSRRVITLNANNDAFMDFAVANNVTGNVSVYIGNGSAFATMTNTITTNSPYGLAAGDFNSDGNIDLLVTNGTSNTTSLRLGNGTGIFGSPTNFTVSTNPQSVDVGDFNLDGSLDFANTNYFGDNVTVCFGNGAGSFNPAVSYTFGGTNTQPRTIKAADVNNDGNLDLVVVRGSTPAYLSVLIGSPTGTFAPVVNYSLTINTPFDITINDFNSDGNRDAIVSSSNTGMIEVLLGSSSGTFSFFNSFSAGNQVYGLISGDMNNDGKTDFVTTDFNGGLSNVKTFYGNGNGTFAFSSFNPSQVNNFDIAAADFDNNGYLDFVLTTGISSGNTARVVWNHPTPTVSITSSASLICVGQSASLTGTGASTYSWSTGATSTSINVTPTITTSYSVIGTSTANCSSNATFTLAVSACTSINEINNDDKFLLYPNPVQKKIHIESDRLYNYVEIFDLTGKLILKTHEKELNAESLDQGIYIIKITFNNGHVVTKKLIKE